MENINEINTKTPEGKLLFAALAIITTTAGYTDKTPNEVLKIVTNLSEKME